jgi:hypothetical protein
LTKYHDLLSGQSESEPLDIKRSIILDFSDISDTGKISGHTVRNEVFGDYELLIDKKIHIIRFGGTKVGEPPWGSKFWNAIHKSTSYKVYYDKMFILFNSDTEKMEFEKQ